MASVLPYLNLIAHFFRALFRSKHEQVILELVLRQLGMAFRLWALGWLLDTTNLPRRRAFLSFLAC